MVIRGIDLEPACTGGVLTMGRAVTLAATDRYVTAVEAFERTWPYLRLRLFRPGSGLGADGSPHERLLRPEQTLAPDRGGAVAVIRGDMGHQGVRDAIHAAFGLDAYVATLAGDADLVFASLDTANARAEARRGR